MRKASQRANRKILHKRGILLWTDFSSGFGVDYEYSDTGRRRYGSSILLNIRTCSLRLVQIEFAYLVAKTAHSRSNRLLLDDQPDSCKQWIFQLQFWPRTKIDNRHAYRPRFDQPERPEWKTRVSWNAFPAHRQEFVACGLDSLLDSLTTKMEVGDLDVTMSAS